MPLSITGVTNIADRHWLPMAEQAVTVIYKLAEHPDVICGQLIKKIANVVMAGQGAGKDGGGEREEAPKTQGNSFLYFAKLIILLIKNSVTCLFKLN